MTGCCYLSGNLRKIIEILLEETTPKLQYHQYVKQRMAEITALSNQILKLIGDGSDNIPYNGFDS